MHTRISIGANYREVKGTYQPPQNIPLAPTNVYSVLVMWDRQPLFPTHIDVRNVSPK